MLHWRTTRAASRRQLGAVLARLRYEVIPSPSIEASVLEHVPREVQIAVTAPPTKGIEATLSLATSLARHGYRVVPRLGPTRPRRRPPRRDRRSPAGRRH